MNKLKGLMEELMKVFSAIERIENDSIANRGYVGECVGSRLVEEEEVDRFVD